MSISPESFKNNQAVNEPKIRWIIDSIYSTAHHNFVSAFNGILFHVLLVVWTKIQFKKLSHALIWWNLNLNWTLIPLRICLIIKQNLSNGHDFGSWRFVLVQIKCMLRTNVRHIGVKTKDWPFDNFCCVHSIRARKLRSKCKNIHNVKKRKNTESKLIYYNI